MNSSTNYSPTQSFGLLLVGPPGTGKTTCCLNFPKPYFADCDNNLSGIARLGKPFLYDTINVEEPREAYRFEKLLQCIKEAGKSPEVETLIIDSITAVSDYVIAHVARKNNRTAKDLRQQDWGEIFYEMKALFAGVRMMGKAVVFTAHETYDKDEVSGILMFKVSFPGQTAEKIAAFFSDMWHTEVVDVPGQKPKYVVRGMPTARINCKNTLQFTTPVIEPTAEALKEMLAHGKS